MKNNKILVWVLIIIVFIFVLFFLGGKKQIFNSQNELTENKKGTNSIFEENKNKLSISENFYDFGTISMKDGIVSRIFKITNESEKDILLSSVTTSCMCTVAFIVNGGERRGPFGMPGHGGFVPKVNDKISAGDIREIEVQFDPNAHGPAGIGLIERVVFLEDENKNIVEFKFRANVTP